MIFGIGTDIVRVGRMQRNLERFGERFARRILADEEWAGFEATVRPAHYLAKRFAAKEAAAKAFGTGFVDGITLHQIAVAHRTGGQPYLVFSGRAREFVAAAGIGEGHLSIADEDDYVVAFATLLRSQS